MTKSICSPLLLLTAFIFIAAPARAIQSRTGGVSGLLTYRDGKPAAGVRVVAIPAEEDSKTTQIIAGQRQTDNSGRYLIEALPPGRYWIFAGPLDAGTYFPGVLSVGEAKAITVTAGGATDRIDFPAVRLLTIKGTVTIDGGGIMPPVEFSFAPADGVVRASKVSVPSSGAFETNLFEGAYRVSMSRLPKGFSVMPSVSGAEDILARGLNVEPATRPLAITLAVSRPKPWGKVSGRVKGHEYFPAALAALSATSGFGSAVGGIDPSTRPLRIRLTRTNADSGTETLPVPPPASVQPDGSFEFPLVPAGVYRVALDPNVIASTTAEFVVFPDDVANVQLDIPVIREITGHVSVERNGPLPALTLEIQFDENAATASMFARFSTQGRTTVAPKMQPDGTFKVSLPDVPLRLAVRVSAFPSGYSLQSFTYGGVDLLQDRLPVGGEQSELRLTIATAPKAWVKISGTVSGLDNALVQPARPRPIPAACGPGGVSIAGGLACAGSGLAGTPFAPGASLAPQRPLAVVLKQPMPTGAAAKTSHTVTPRPDGSFEFEGVFPGNYIVDLDSRPLFASGPVEITVRDADIRGIQLAIAGSRSVPVRPVMEGGGAVPFPRLALMTNSGATGLEVNVVADRTGRISVVLPEVESRIGIPSSALPAGYTVKSMTYGSTDLLRSPLKISPSDTDELHVTFAAAPNASFKVSGNVVGFDKVRSASRNWNARITGTPLTQFGAADTVLAPVRPDGSFEFPGLWPGDYDIRLSPDPQGTLGAKITVSDRDISNVRIVTPGSRQVTAHVFIEGDAPIPDFRLTATPKFGEGVAVWFNVRGNPDKRSDLVATPPLAIPLGEQRITIDMPHGYTLKSITYRGADVTRGTAQFSASDTDELRISFAFDASRAFRIAGRIVGMENLRPEMQQGPDGTAPRSPLIMTLSDRARGAALLTTPVNGDGSFEFPRVVQGDYTLTSAPPGVTRGATPDVQITVSDRDVTGLELRVPPVDAR